MRRFAAVVVVWVLFSASGANAGTISIEFDLSNSAVSLLGGIITIPPDGAITTASATINVQGSSLTNPVGGAASLSGLNIAASVNGTVASIATLTGGVNAAQVGAASGALSGGLANLMIGTLTLNLSALINCTPTGPCGALGSFPISMMSTNPITGVGNLGVGNLGTFGNGTLNAILSLSIGGNSAVIALIGQEVNRTFLPSVPEPNTFGLFGFGMLGLAAAGWRRTRSRSATIQHR